MTDPTERGISKLTLVPATHEALHEPVSDISVEEIMSPKVQGLIKGMQQFLESQGPGGVGLAAPQVGERLPIAIIDILPPPHVKDVEPFSATIVNPIYEGIGETQDFWEGCLTTGIGPESPVVKVPRYQEILATWYDEHGEKRTQELTGPAAFVFQHETKHLQGILITDEAVDSRTQAEHMENLRAQQLARQAIQSPEN